MSQSNFVALFIFAAFIVFITLRGELRQYMGLLFGTQIASTNTTTTASTNPLTTFANAAATISKIVAVAG